MGLTLLGARLVLAVVFGVAGLAKLADRAGSRQALRDFGAPPSLAGPLGLLLPVAELAVAVALVPATTAWWGALGAATLLLAFVAAIGGNLARGRTPECRCFGQLHSAPAGSGTLARNVGLAALAGLIVWQGRAAAGPSVVRWAAGLSAGEDAAIAAGLLVAALLAVQGWFLIQLLMQQGRLLLRIEALEARAGVEAPPAAERAAPQAGLPIGAPAPAFRLRDLHGEPRTLRDLRAAGQPLLLVFSDPSCAACDALLPDLGRWQRELAATLAIAVVSRGTPDANRGKGAEQGLIQVLLQEDREAAQAYGVVATPSAVVVRPDGSIGSALAQGPEEIRALAARAVGQPERFAALAPDTAALSNGRCPNCGQYHGNGNGVGVAAAPATMIGTPAPTFALPDLDGKTVDLAEFRGHPTLVVFWNPGCGFCRQMLPELKAWEAARPPAAPKLLVVSTGDAATNRAQGLRSPVLLDQRFATGDAFGASGTPSAVLVDAEGKIASPVGVGAEAVLRLAGAGASQG